MIASAILDSLAFWCLWRSTPLSRWLAIICQRRKFAGQSSPKSDTKKVPLIYFPPRRNDPKSWLLVWPGRNTRALTRIKPQEHSAVMFTALFSPYKISCFSNPAVALSVVYDPISSHSFYSHRDRGEEGQSGGFYWYIPMVKVIMLSEAFHSNLAAC